MVAAIVHVSSWVTTPPLPHPPPPPPLLLVPSAGIHTKVLVAKTFKLDKRTLWWLVYKWSFGWCKILDFWQLVDSWVCVRREALVTMWSLYYPSLLSSILKSLSLQFHFRLYWNMLCNVVY